MKRHPYYIPKAIERKEELDRQKNLVPVEKILSVFKECFLKKSNSRYVEKVNYNKRNGIKPWEN
jgi:hypothetical protein